MAIRLLPAAAGFIFAPAVFAQDAIRPAISKKTHKAAKVHRKTNRASGDMMGSAYSMQKDEMTR
jgi:hypothetical protein